MNDFGNDIVGNVVEIKPSKMEKSVTLLHIGCVVKVEKEYRPGFYEVSIVECKCGLYRPAGHPVGMVYAKRVLVPIKIKKGG